MRSKSLQLASVLRSRAERELGQAGKKCELGQLDSEGDALTRALLQRELADELEYGDLGRALNDGRELLPFGEAPRPEPLSEIRVAMQVERRRCAVLVAELEAQTALCRTRDGRLITQTLASVRKLISRGAPPAAPTQLATAYAALAKYDLKKPPKDTTVVVTIGTNAGLEARVIEACSPDDPYVVVEFADGRTQYATVENLEVRRGG